MFHYTDAEGFKAIASQVDWTFKASPPPGEREFGAYFTHLRPDANRFSARTRIPVMKQAFIFVFTGDEGLRPMRGGRGRDVFLSPVDYIVTKSSMRQVACGPTNDVLEISTEKQ